MEARSIRRMMDKPGGNLQEIDQLLVELLAEDGRRSNVELAQQLGLTEGTVRKRLARLLRDGLIRVTGSRNLRKLGYDTEVLIGVQAQPGTIESTVDALRNERCVLSIALTAGRYDLVLRACFRSRSELERFLTADLSRIPGIGRTETSYVLSNPKRSNDWLGEDEAEASPDVLERIIRVPIESNSGDAWWRG
jgi:Lrp/AsnC family transcriptional regulator for asnA, asnC and gidA